MSVSPFIKPVKNPEIFYFINIFLIYKRKIQTKNKRISSLKVNSYADFTNNLQEFWNRDEKKFFWLYQCKERLQIFERIAEVKTEKKEEKMFDISDILFEKKE